MSDSLEQLYEQFATLYKDYDAVYQEAIKDGWIYDDELKVLMQYMDGMLPYYVKLEIAKSMQKDPDLTAKQGFISCISQYEQRLDDLETKALEMFELAKQEVSWNGLRLWNEAKQGFKLQLNAFKSLLYVDMPGIGLVRFGELSPKDYIISRAAYWETKSKDLDKKERELDSVRQVLRLESQANSESRSDARAIEGADFAKIKELYRNLVDRMQTTLLNINVHFVGWMKVSEFICMCHKAAEDYFDALMKAQEAEIANAAAWKSIANNVALTLANVIFPGISTPLKTVLTAVVGAAANQKVEEYKEKTAEIGGKVQQIKILETTIDKKKATQYTAALVAISADLKKAATLTLNANKETKLSVAPATGAAASLSEKHLEIYTMIHEAGDKCVHLLNILQDIDTRLTRMDDDLFNDENVDTSEVLQGLREMFKTLSSSVNQLTKKKESLAPPSIDITNPSDNPIYSDFLNVMLLKWLPSLKSKRKKTESIVLRTSTGWVHGSRQVLVDDYVIIIDSEVQKALIKHCGFQTSDFSAIYAEGGFMSGLDELLSSTEEIDRAVENLVSASKRKLKVLEKKDVWMTHLGL